MQKFFIKVAREFALTVLEYINYLVPKRAMTVISAFPDVDDHLVAILRFHARSGTGRKLCVLVRRDPLKVRNILEAVGVKIEGGIQIVNKRSVRGFLKYCRSDLALYTHGLYGLRRFPPRQRVINLWHGMPLKGIWRAIAGSHVPECTQLISTSIRFSEVLSEVSGFPTAKIWPLGSPRNDLLFSTSASARRFRADVTKGVDRMILFLPTYRKSKVGYITSDGVEMGNTLYMSDTEIALLRALLGKARTRMLVKPHPMSVHYGRDLQLDDNLWIVSDEWFYSRGVTLYEALGQSDALVTDVSSVAVDFLCVRRPTIFYIPDLKQFEARRRFLLNPIREWVAGPICETADELFFELQRVCDGHDAFIDRRPELARDLNPQCAPVATRALYASLSLM